MAICYEMQSESRFAEKIRLSIDLIDQISIVPWQRTPSVPPKLLITSLWISRIFSEVRIMIAAMV
jgi:hypothetical protein